MNVIINSKLTRLHSFSLIMVLLIFRFQSLRRMKMIWTRRSTTQ